MRKKEPRNPLIYRDIQTTHTPRNPQKYAKKPPPKSTNSPNIDYNVLEKSAPRGTLRLGTDKPTYSNR